ncbi:MAG: PIN domain-containing protein [Prevotellaceae bacterium]|jgi:predicted nucleic acid-binding protein|nr:PIN domain-containing protein [Prevotellaceae bacterium]
MIRILLDTNVIIDYASQREPFFADADKIFDCILDNKISAYVSASAVTDIFYILKRENSKEDTLSFLKELLNVVNILTVDKNVIISALYSGWNDFEDAVQAHISIENNIDVVITRNTKDFKCLNEVNVLTPADFLDRWLSNKFSLMRIL